MANVELTLPRLVSSREAARRLIGELGDVQGRVVTLNARNLRSATPSAADEFVKAALENSGAIELDIVGAGSVFVRDVEASAEARNVADRVHQLSVS